MLPNISIAAILTTLAVLISAAGCRSAQDTVWIRVVVTLALPEMSLSTPDSERRRATKLSRERLLAHVPAANVRLLETLELTGQLVLEVEAASLDAIKAAPEVKAVAEDQKYSVPENNRL